MFCSTYLKPWVTSRLAEEEYDNKGEEDEDENNEAMDFSSGSQKVTEDLDETLGPRRVNF